MSLPSCEAMLDHLLKFFVTFLVVVQPISVIPIFVAMTEGNTEMERRRMARRGVLVAGSLFVVFALSGGPFLRIMGISLDAFRIFGGLLLFLIALEMVFGRASASRTSGPEEEEGMKRPDVSVFPLAFPFIAGPGSLATVMLAFGGAWDEPALFAGLVGCVVVALSLTLLALYMATSLVRLMGVTGASVVTRVFGVVLGALSVQYVIDGIRGSLMN